jgi:hypothetical protein
MSLHLFGRTCKSFFGRPSSSGASHRTLPWIVNVDEAWLTFISSERPKSARQAVPSPWMRTFVYSWDMNEFGTVPRKLKLTPAKFPWMTSSAWTTKEELRHQARGIETNSNTYDIANQLQYLWADFIISFSWSILQANTYDLESSDDRKILVLFLQIKI